MLTLSRRSRAGERGDDGVSMLCERRPRGKANRIAFTRASYRTDAMGSSSSLPGPSSGRDWIESFSSPAEHKAWSSRNLALSEAAKSATRSRIFAHRGALRATGSHSDALRSSSKSLPVARLHSREQLKVRFDDAFFSFEAAPCTQAVSASGALLSPEVAAPRSSAVASRCGNHGSRTGR
jgi:hypothetical protein